MNTISVNDLRTLLENAWAAGYIARDAGLSPVEATTTRAKYVENKISPYVPAKKIEEVRKEPEFDIYKYLGITKDDLHKSMDDFFFGDVRKMYKDSGKDVPDWMHL